MKYFSLFSGIGGFELGIQQAYEEKNKNNKSKIKGLQTEGHSPNNSGKSLQRATCIGYSEIDKYAIQIYQGHFPTHENYGDATKIIAKEIPDHNLLIAGFPCQAFSIAGKRGGFKDTRGTLFFEIARILKAKRPENFLLENVKGLLNHDKGNTFATIISTLDELGYDCQWDVLNSKNFGVPQNRERVFIVGHIRGESRPKVFPVGETTKADYRTKFPNIPEIGEAIRIYGSEGIAPPVKPHHTLLARSRFKYNELRKIKGNPVLRTIPGQTLVADFRGDEGLRIRKSGIAPTLKKRSESEDYYNSILAIRNNKIRRLTPIECERLQGFPDNWTEGVSDTQRYKTLGNAVTVNVVREIIKKLRCGN